MNDIAIALLIGTESRTTFASDRPHRAASPRRGASLGSRVTSLFRARRAAPAAPAAAGC